MNRYVFRNSTHTRLLGFMIVILCLSEQILASPKVTQVAHLESPTYELLDICAIEEYSQFSRIDIFADTLRTRIFSLEVGHSSPLHFQPQPDFWYSNGFLRFAILHIAQFPDPLILVIGVGPGATDIAFESYVIAEIKGQFIVLNQEPFISSLQGGLYIGDINDEFGYGIASWNRIWDDEVASAPHQYAIHIFSWNAQESCLQKRITIRTEERYEDWHDALTAYNLHVVNLIDTVIGEDHSTLGIEPIIEKVIDIPQQK